MLHVNIDFLCGETKNQNLHKEIKSLFTKKHAARINEILQKTQWMSNSAYDRYTYTDKNGRRISEDLVLSGEVAAGYKVLNPSKQFLAAHNGKDVIMSIDPVDGLYHTACMKDTTSYYSWLNEITKYTSDYVNYFYIINTILAILGVKPDDETAAGRKLLKAQLKKIIDAQLDYLEFLLTRSPESYARFKARPDVRQLANLQYVLDSDNNDDDDDDVDTLEFALDPNEVLTPKFRKMISSNGASIVDKVVIVVKCNQATIGVITAPAFY
jgi:hypothetical protein